MTARSLRNLWVRHSTAILTEVPRSCSMDMCHHTWVPGQPELPQLLLPDILPHSHGCNNLLYSFFPLLFLFIVEFSLQFKNLSWQKTRKKPRLNLAGEEKGLVLQIIQERIFAFLARYSYKTGPAVLGSCQTLWRTWFTEKQSCNTQGTAMTTPCRGKCHEQEARCMWQLSHFQDTKSHPWSICFSEATIT